MSISRTPSSARYRAPGDHESVARSWDNDRTLARDIKIAVAGGGLALASILGISWHTQQNRKSQTPTHFVFSGDQTFTFQSGQGEDDAINKIQGSGMGPGNPSWDAAKKVVDGALGQHDGEVNLPQVGQQIDIPSQEIPSKPQK